MISGASVIWRAAGTFAMFAALLPALTSAPNAQGSNTPAIFLVATRSLSDPLFQHSVIVMLPSAPPPLIAGLIINKPTTISVRQLFPNAPTLKNSETAYFGGPVDPSDPSLVLRAANSPQGASRLFADIYASTDPDAIEGILKDPKRAENLRVIIGRAQWSREQLHGEMLQGAWYIVPANADMVFSSDPEGVWRSLVQRAELQEVEAAGTSALFLPVGA